MKCGRVVVGDVGQAGEAGEAGEASEEMQCRAGSDGEARGGLPRAQPGQGRMKIATRVLFLVYGEV